MSDPIFRLLGEVARNMGIKAFVVGGFVREYLRHYFSGEQLEEINMDIDIVVEGDGLTYARELARRLGVHRVQVYEKFGTASLLLNNYHIEVVGARKESYRYHSRKPTVVPGTIEDDQRRRDFTINAMSISLNEENFGELIDPFGGIHDLQAGIIRTPVDPDVTYSDDPLRMMRAIRFATVLGFQVEENSLRAITRNAERIRIVSQERITDELNKIILAKEPSRGFRLLFQTGLLRIILPELHALHGTEYKEGKGHKDNLFHTLIVLDNVARQSDKLWLRWAALLHDIGKPSTKKWIEGTGWTFHGHDHIGAKMIPPLFRRLKLPTGENMKYVQKLVSLHLRPIVLAEETVTDSAIRRLLFEAGDDIDDLMILCSADMSSKIPEKIRKYQENFELVKKKLVEIEEKDRLRNWQPPISGEIIMETFGLKPSKEVGIIKTTIREAILEGHIPNEKEAAYQFMLEIGKKLGLKPVSSH